MMRKIKFRVWHKADFIDEPKMYYNAQQAYDGSGLEPCGLGWISCFGDFLDDDNYEVMQFTGLFDKNGKEIYEGDILKSTSSYNKVFWNEEGWGIKVMKRHKKNGGWIVGHISKGLMVDAKYGEVVGNVFEDGDLLDSE